MCDNKIKQLSNYVDVKEEKISNSIDNIYSVMTRNGEKEYLVVTEEEADEEVINYLDRFLEDYIYGKIPHKVREFFDRERWVEHAMKEGRGHYLAYYDGIEGISDDCFIYRIN